MSRLHETFGGVTRKWSIGAVKLSSSSPEQLPARKPDIGTAARQPALRHWLCIGRRCAVMEKAQIAGSGLRRQSTKGLGIFNAAGIESNVLTLMRP